MTMLGFAITFAAASMALMFATAMAVFVVMITRALTIVIVPAGPIVFVHFGMLWC